MNVVVVVHFCRPDFHVALKWLRWARWLSRQPGAPAYDIVFFAAASTDTVLVDQIRAEIAGWRGARVEVNPTYFEKPELGYAAMANVAFRGALECTERLYPGQPTLWCETDAIPMRATWVEEIQAEYVAARKPFMGDFHPLGAIPHMSGNAVYAANWRELAPSIARLPEPRPVQGWDTLCVAETLPQSHHSFRIQQVWIQPMPKITEENVGMIHPETALFHRCKDGSLIDVLCRRMGAPTITLGVPMTKKQPVFVAPAPAPFGATSILTNGVPPSPTTGTRMHILVTSCRRDVEFTNYCLRSIDKYAKGFAGVTLLVPTADAGFFGMRPQGVQLKTFNEVPGKGFVHHMLMVCRADEVCPDADTILHIDPDCMFWKPTVPKDFAPGGKCLLVREHYDLIATRNANRLIWRDCVKAATGIVPEYDTMVRHPNVYPRALYGHVRQIVEAHTGQKFDDYVLACNNHFPQSFCEFVTLGTVGLRDMRDSFTVVDYDHEKDSVECNVAGRQHQYVYRSNRDHIVEGYSYNPAAYRNDWNRLMRGITPPFYVK